MALLYTIYRQLRNSYLCNNTYLFDHDHVFSVAGQRDKKAGNDQNTMAKLVTH